ncbi:MAG TPA: CHAT domain-containing protein [Pseudomonadales bacterium]
MVTRHVSWLCAACCSFGSAAALGCGDPETLLGTHTFDVGTSPVLVRIEQQGNDLLVARDDASGTTLFNHPNDRAFFELVLLQPEDGSTQQLCIHSAFRNAASGEPYAISIIDAARFDPDTLQRFVDAGRLWASGDSTARSQATAAYAALAQVQEFPLREYAALYEIRARIHGGEAGSAVRAIARLAPESTVLAGAPHLLPWYEGLAQLRERAFTAAVASLTRALPLATHKLDRAEIGNLLGEALVSADRVDDGAAQLEVALADAGSDHSLLARIHNNMGYVLLRRAYGANMPAVETERWLRASIDEHLVARAFAVNAGDSSEQVLIDNNLGTLYERVRELRKAHHHYREALQLTEAAGDRFAMQLLYQNLGALNQRLGDYPKSRGYLERALQLAEGSSEAAAYRTNCTLGTTYRLLGSIAEALAIHASCRDVAATVADHRALVEALVELSEDHMVAARSDPAELDAAWSAIRTARSLLDTHFADILALAPGNGVQRDPRAVNLCTTARVGAGSVGPSVSEQRLYAVARVLDRHALLAQRFGEPDAALADLALAAAIIGPARYTGQIDIFDTALRVYGAQGNIAFARACGEAAMTLSERLHEDLEAERNGPAWSAKTHEIYVALADLLLAQQGGADDSSAREAFAVAERAMGISLRQHLSLPRGDSAEDEDARLRIVLNTLADEHAALSAEQKAQLLPVAYYHQHDLVELSRLREQQSVAIPPSLDVAGVQARLSDGQHVLYYYIGANDAWLFTLDAGNFAAHRLGAASELANLLGAVERDLRSPNGAPAAGLSALSHFLLPPALQLDSTRELVIVPHRDLYKIPFSALVQPNGAALVDDFAVKTTPSLSAYFMDKPAAPAAHSGDIAVFADPLFNTADLRGAAADGVAQTGLQTWSAQLERLPYTELEANSLKALFRPERTLDFLGRRATLDNLAGDAARNARILHLATHGYFQSTGSDNVGLVLATINERNERVPGFVTLTELFSHRFNNELVVVSGCDTAMGMQLAGEGMMGVTRGFLAQGARHVISTLWPVSDRASAEFMGLFYRNLHESGSVAQALRAAQSQLKALPEFRHPYYWAPYVLTTVSPADAMRFDAADV